MPKNKNKGHIMVGSKDIEKVKEDVYLGGMVNMHWMALSAWAAEYIDCISVEG